MDIIISNSIDKPIYVQIKDQLKTMIINETLKEGDALPSMRLLAKELRISVITTKRAYEELEREGFIETVGGKGCFVAGKNLDFIKEEQQRLIEEHLQEAVSSAKNIGVSLPELVDIITLLYKEE
ncbi:GntR family transcriptional regulator [Alloiococcus sp. CFN-8]|uniref:GntR family transcriptional regulator n=1 Tax=Alloiococcus sp. CFN-8 TaxID=3416081 RepID=UPI003CECDF19